MSNFTASATSGILTGLAKWLTPALFVVIGFISLRYYELNKEIEQLREDNTTLSSQLATATTEADGLEAAILRYQNDVVAAESEQARLTRLIEDLRQQNRNKEDDLRRAIGRQDVVWQKPTLVQRMARKSWTEFSNRASCVTGAEEKCE